MLYAHAWIHTYMFVGNRQWNLSWGSCVNFLSLCLILLQFICVLSRLGFSTFVLRDFRLKLYVHLSSGFVLSIRCPSNFSQDGTQAKVTLSLCLLKQKWRTRDGVQVNFQVFLASEIIGDKISAHITHTWQRRTQVVNPLRLKFLLSK